MTFTDLPNAELIERAVKRGEGVLDKNGALVVETGKRTGRSPNDRFIVKESTTENDIDWGKVNKPFDADKFDALWDRVEAYLSTQEHFLSKEEMKTFTSTGIKERLDCVEKLNTYR